MERICKPGVGLFPAPKDIKFSCSCPDWAVMCKHVAAVLYGVGARLDQQPELLFSLRRVDAQALVAQAGAGLASAKAGPAAAKVLDDSELADVFGIEMAERASTRAATERKRRSVKTPGTTPRAKTRGEGSSVAKQTAVKRKKPAKKSPKTVPEKPATAKPPAPLPARFPQDRRQDCESQGGGTRRGNRCATACVDQGASQAVMSSLARSSCRGRRGWFGPKRRHYPVAALGLEISCANSIACAQMAAFANPETPFTRWRTTERARITAGARYSAFPIDRCEQVSRVNNDIMPLILYY